MGRSITVNLTHSATAKTMISWSEQGIGSFGSPIAAPTTRYESLLGHGAGPMGVHG